MNSLSIFRKIHRSPWINPPRQQPSSLPKHKLFIIFLFLYSPTLIRWKQAKLVADDPPPPHTQSSSILFCGSLNRPSPSLLRSPIPLSTLTSMAMAPWYSSPLDHVIKGKNDCHWPRICSFFIVPTKRRMMLVHNEICFSHPVGHSVSPVGSPWTQLGWERSGVV